MGYPDTFEGFMIESQKNWSDFKKKEVSPCVGQKPMAKLIFYHSINPSNLENEISISGLKPVVYAAVTFIP